MEDRPDIAFLLTLHLERKIRARELDCLTLVHVNRLTISATARRLNIPRRSVQRSLRRVASLCA